jgi:hypothetical protein
MYFDKPFIPRFIQNDLPTVFPPFYWVLKKGKERKRNRKERKGED